MSTPDLRRGTLQGWHFEAVRTSLWILLKVLTRLRVEGQANVPPTGGLLVVSNHLHNADPVALAVALPRPLHYMAKKELFSIPVIGWALRGVGAFPVDRGRADRTALRRAEATLAQGIAVGMFPEGTRSVTRALQRAHAGAGLIAIRSGAPILPMVITGSERLPFNGTKGKRRDDLPSPGPGHKGVRVRIGKPFALIPRADGTRLTAAEAADQIMAVIAAMLPEDYRGVYASSASSSSGTSTSGNASS